MIFEYLEALSVDRLLVKSQSTQQWAEFVENQGQIEKEIVQQQTGWFCAYNDHHVLTFCIIF